MFIWIFIFSLQSIHLHIFLIMTIRVDLICSYLHLLSLCFFLSVFFFSLEQKQICLNVHHHTQTPRATCTTRVSRSVKPKPSIWFEFYLYIFYPSIPSHFLLIWKWSFLPFLSIYLRNDFFPCFLSDDFSATTFSWFSWFSGLLRTENKIMTSGYREQTLSLFTYPHTFLCTQTPGLSYLSHFCHSI